MAQNTVANSQACGKVLLRVLLEIAGARPVGCRRGTPDVAELSSLINNQLNLGTAIGESCLRCTVNVYVGLRDEKTDAMSLLEAWRLHLSPNNDMGDADGSVLDVPALLSWLSATLRSLPAFALCKEAERADTSIEAFRQYGTGQWDYVGDDREVLSCATPVRLPGATLTVSVSYAPQAYESDGEDGGEPDVHEAMTHSLKPEQYSWGKSMVSSNSSEPCDTEAVRLRDRGDSEGAMESFPVWLGENSDLDALSWLAGDRSISNVTKDLAPPFSLGLGPATPPTRPKKEAAEPLSEELQTFVKSLEGLALTTTESVAIPQDMADEARGTAAFRAVLEQC